MELSDWLGAAYERFFDKLVSVAYRKTGSRSLAEDLTQDTFVLAMLHKDELGRHPNLEAWLMVTLRNLIQNERRHMRLGEVPLNEAFHLLKAETFDSVDEILPDELSPKEREILLWRYQDRVECREIANRLGISETACRSRIFRALERCKKALDEHREDDEGRVEHEAAGATGK